MQPSESSQSKVLRLVAYGCLRLAVFYVLTAVTSLVIFKILKLWPSHSMFFLTWPAVWVHYIIFWLSSAYFFWDGVMLLAALLVLMLPIVWGLRQGNKWYRNAAVVVTLYLEIFIAILLNGLGV